MKKHLRICAFLSVLPIVCCFGDILDTVRSEGLQGKITYFVIDEFSCPISNVLVRASFQRDGKPSTIITGKTDANGRFSAEAQVNLKVNAQFSKDGYYRSSHHHWFLSSDKSRMNDGKWLPWNTLVTVKLKKKKNPRYDDVRQIFKRNMSHEESYGLDLRVGDLVEPNGKGKFADCFVAYTYKGDRSAPDYFAQGSIWMAGNGGGFIRLKRDLDCELKFPVTVPELGYTNRLDFSHSVVDGKHVGNFPREAEDLIAFKIIRLECGGGIATNFGIIRSLKLGEDREGNGSFSIFSRYYYNDITNDRGTEYAK